MLYTIENKNITVNISSLGAEIKRLTYKGEDRIHDSNPLFWGRSAPILFPNIGTILNSVAYIDNLKYAMKKHGFLRDTEASKVSSSHDSVTFTFVSTKESLEIYPYNFKLEIKYFLENDELFSEIHILNTGNKDMHYNLGLHPAFKVPLEENEKFEDYCLTFNNPKEYDVLSVNLKNGTIEFDKIAKRIEKLERIDLNYDDYKNDALVFDNLSTDEITLKSNVSNKGVTFKFDGFPMLGIWTPNHVHANFICIEPWIGCADKSNHNQNFLDKIYLVTLPVNQEKVHSYSWKFF